MKKLKSLSRLRDSTSVCKTKARWLRASIIILCLFCLFSCASHKQIRQLEKRIDLLEMRAEDHEDLIKVSHKLTEEEKESIFRRMKRAREVCQPGWKYQK